MAESRNNLISVILPFYNRVDAVLTALACVGAQTHPEVELIVVNDGSTDDVTQIKNKLTLFKNSRYVEYAINAGPSKARNVGIGIATGNYIAFLDSDDEWHADKLAIQLKVMKENNWLFSHMSYCRKDCISGQVTSVSSGRTLYRFPWIAFTCRIATPTVMLSRDFLSTTRFNECYRVAEDQILWATLAKRAPLHGVDLLLTTVNVDGSTTARNLRSQAQAQHILRNELLAEHPFLRAAHLVYGSSKIAFYCALRRFGLMT